MSSSAAVKVTPPEEAEYSLDKVKEIEAEKHVLYRLQADGKIRAFILRLGLASGVLGVVFTPFLWGLGLIQSYGMVMTLLLWTVIAVVDYGANFPGYFRYLARSKLHAFAQSMGLKGIISMAVVLIITTVLGAVLINRVFAVTRVLADVAITYVEEKAEKALRKAPAKPSGSRTVAKAAGSHCSAQKEMLKISATYCDSGRAGGLEDNSQKDICKPCP